MVGCKDLSESKALAVDMLKSDYYQVRCCAIFILGFIAARDGTVLLLLKDTARSDEGWQVQEIIAKAFDRYCKDNGYESSLPEIKAWLSDKHPNVCRAVTEGLRIRTGRPYFKTHPEVAIDLLSQHRSGDSEYLRKSVGNSLRDISKKYGELVKMEISKWDLQDQRIAFTCDHVLKRH
ncbi:HEAT repeat domain-containing protein [Chryseobacterium sp. PET-29]|uniref:HEAT repeat domain-containing protein n=1 Tax=Chryseobacterium sp. PET-29 TaxID=2983267 RepID=UPI0021E56E73|nr:HEAT repeat domain-containing protein [Chryseobacterium sp. PET-29]